MRNTQVMDPGIAFKGVPTTPVGSLPATTPRMGRMARLHSWVRPMRSPQRVHATTRAPHGWLAVGVVWLLCAAGCATPLRPGFEQPSVKVTAFRPLPTEGLAPRFEITLRVVNPNSFDLVLRGLSYKAFLDDYEIIDGATTALPLLPAYGEADIELAASVSLLEGLRFLNNLLQKPKDQLRYRLQAKLDIGTLFPALRIEESGVLGALER